MELIDTDKIEVAPWRCNEEDETTFLKLVAMMRKFGQVRNITVREVAHDKFTGDCTAYECIEGRNILAAAKVAEIPVIWAYNAGPIDDTEAKEITLMLNELNFLPDWVDIAKLVRDIVKDSNIQNAVGHSMFTAKEIKKFLSILQFDWDKFDMAKKTGNLSLFAAAERVGIDEETLQDLKEIPDGLEEEDGA